MRSARLRWLALALALAGASCARALGDCTPARLRCEDRQDPQGIDAPQPRLSWWLESERRGARQSAYQIGVASSEEGLRQGRFDLWDSGKVLSRASTQVEYAGAPLPSLARCHWQVRVWDARDRPSSWSAPARWTMGMLAEADWQAQWIGADERAAVTGATFVHGYHALEAASADAVKWVQVDLGRSRAFDEVVLHPPSPLGFAQVRGFGFPRRFRIEAADDPAFAAPTLLADCTQSDFPNPGNAPARFAAGGATARYVRVTATRLWDRASGPAPFCFALAELEVVAAGENLALHAPASAADSIERSDWSLARLTDGETLAAAGSAAGPGNAAVLLRREFEARPGIARATISFCGLGYAELLINGEKIGDQVLAPGFTDYARRVQYLSFEVADAIRPGRNALGVTLGGGWFNLATPDLFGFERAPWSAAPRLLLHLRIEYADGSAQTLVSDSSWRCSTGEITFNCVRSGETIDARAAQPGWALPGFDASAWQPVRAVAAPGGRLVAAAQPPIRVTQTIRPVAMTEPQPGVFVFDLGVNLSGWARLRTRGPRGTRVTLEYNERLLADGTLDAANLASHTQGRFQTDEFILRGGEPETFEPRFTYHGFRYVQVRGLAEPPSRDSLVACRVGTDPEPAGRFRCSDERINRLQEVILRTLLNNMHGIPTDCPQREKMGWLCDGCVGMETAFYNLQTATFYGKWCEDMRDAQDANGHVPDIVPTSGWGRAGGDGAPGAMADPWWGGAIVFAPWKLYLQYADVRALRAGYPAMKAYVDYLSSTAQEGQIVWGLGDWLDESAGGGARRAPVAQTSTAAYFACARIVAATAELLHQDEDARRYAALAAAIADAFNARFLDEDSGRYAPDSQTAQALPLALGMAPAAARPRVAAQLEASILGARAGHVSTGIVGLQPLFRALTDLGREDLAWTMLTQEDHPGWLFMLDQGATSIWEDWNGAYSLDHPALGCIGAWFYEGLAGIRPDPAAPGFERIILRPAVVGDLGAASAEYDSPHGLIRSAWTRSGDQFALELRVPANVAATLFLPARAAAEVTESGAPVVRAEAVRFLREEPGRVVFALDSGEFHFRSTLPPR